MNAFPITFFYPYPDEFPHVHRWSLTDAAPWSVEGKERRRAWIVQTYRWLRHFGHDVHISAVLPKQGTVVFIPEKESFDSLIDQYSADHKSLTFVVIRADVIEFRSPLADIEILQNGRFADKPNSFFIPHWPQPGIIPRDTSRGATLESITFKGGFGNLHAMFRSEQWKEYLRSNGITFEIASKHTQGARPRWHDYKNADLALAVRPLHGDGGMRCDKPASKLINAWHAGVPAMVGPEYAFQELYEHELDYIQVQTLPQAIGAIDMLRNNPDLYLAMVQHGRRRAQEFTYERITEFWAHVLFEEVPHVVENFTRRCAQLLPLSMRRCWNVITNPPELFELRKIGGYIYREAFASKASSQE